MENFNFVESPNPTGKVIDTITITSNDHLSFPTFFITKNHLSAKTAPAIRMLYDRKKAAIGIVFVGSGDEPGTYKINYSENYGATCKIKAFLINNEIDTKLHADKYAYKKYPADNTAIAGSDIFVIQLKRRELIEQGGIEDEES